MKCIKIVAVLSSLTVAMPSCLQVHQIASVNMISTRNVDKNSEYVLLSTYQGGTKKELKAAIKAQKRKESTIDEAINRTVKTVPGGEYLMNCKILHLKKGKKTGYAVEGDVWGLSTNQYHGWKPGDDLMYRENLKWKKGQFVGHKDVEWCLIKGDDDAIHSVRYNEIVRP